jgi:hypothetical protein
MSLPRVYDPGSTDARETGWMSRTHGRPGGTDEYAELDGPRRPGTHAQDLEPGHAPALTTSADPRLAGHGAPAAGLLALQRSAGNAAVASLVGPPSTVQRAVTIDEMEVTAAPQPTAQQEGAAYGNAQTTQQDGSAGGTNQPVTSDGGTTTIHGAHLSIEAPMTEAHGVLRADTIIADSVVASSYSPGAGNVW